jgi:hypothetical protein
LETGDSEAGKSTTLDRNFGVIVNEIRVDIMAAAKVIRINGVFFFHRYTIKSPVSKLNCFSSWVIVIILSPVKLVF